VLGLDPLWMCVTERLSEPAPNPSTALVEQLRPHRTSQGLGVVQQQLFHFPSELLQLSPLSVVEGAFTVLVHQLRQALAFPRRQPS